MIWFTGSALGICILMIVGLIAVILVNGLSFFWPQPLGPGHAQGRERAPGRDRRPASRSPTPDTRTTSQKHRIQLRLGNRDLLGFDFKWIDEDDIVKREQPGGRLLRRAARVRPASRHAGAREGGRAGPRPRTRGRRPGASGARREGRAETAPPSRRSRRTRSAPSTTASSRRASIRGSSTCRPAEDPGRDLAAGAGRDRADSPPSRRRSTRRSRRSCRRSSRAPRRPPRDLQGRGRAREGAAVPRHLPRLPGQRPRVVRAACPVYAGRLWDVLQRRSAGVQHRGRHLPRHLRHRDDGAHHEHHRGAPGRAGGALPARVREAGACWCAPCASR